MSDTAVQLEPPESAVIHAMFVEQKGADAAVYHPLPMFTTEDGKRVYSFKHFYKNRVVRVYLRTKEDGTKVLMPYFGEK